MFVFKGPVAASKSWFNRALVIQHFNSNVEIEAFSKSDDVVYLQKAIQSVWSSQTFDLGLGGTSFRFFVFLISRYPGSWIVKAHERLLERPQQDLLHLLNQLGVQAEFKPNELLITSEGWKPKGKIKSSAELSSQFVSGLLLSSWNLDNDLELEIKKPITSFGYLKLTLELLHQSGMQIQTEETSDFLFLKIPEKQKAQVDHLAAELDISSAFSLITAAVVAGNVQITNWPLKSHQPDLIFTDIFKRMYIEFQIQNHEFRITQQKSWKAIEVDLNNSPDLFPVLSVLCALAEGVSVLKGASQLRHKESDRILKTQELLRLAGFKTETLADGLTIFGQSSIQEFQKQINFNPDHDHRMAMAAAILKLKGYNIEIENPEVVNKSYPDFWKDIGLKL